MDERKQDQETRQGLESAETSSNTENILTAGTQLGRFTVLEKVGSGGMGVVYAAYDSLLDRKVALKLLRWDSTGEKAILHQERLLREAKAMARLAHPNVITVYDAGTFQGQVFVAMEFVDGMTASQWLQEKKRSLVEILNIFRQAGKGLAAAHGAGLVHRDVKPDNILLGADGRVKVSDFGLVASGQAHHTIEKTPDENKPESITQTGALMGSPAYMSPEQHHGNRVDASSDQFSFCVALFEAIHGHRPFNGDSTEELASNIEAGRMETGAKRSSIPNWLSQILQRGLQTDPDKRYSSMNKLLAALNRDPARQRRRVAAFVLVILLLLVSAWSIHMAASSEKALCRDSARHLAGVWDSARKQKVKDVFFSSDRPYARETFVRVADALDDYAGAWVDNARDSCLATQVRGEQSDTVFELRKTCLARRLSELDALVELFASGKDTKIVDKAVKAIYSLTPLSVCADVQGLMALVPPPENPDLAEKVKLLHARLDKVNALEKVGKYKGALKESKAIAADAERIDFPEVRAEALYMFGKMQYSTKELDASTETLARAARESARAHDDRLTAKILISMIYVLGNLQDLRKQALALAPAAQAAVARAGGESLQQASLASGLGVVLDADGRQQESLEKFQQALKIYRQVKGEQFSLLATTLDNASTVLKEQGKFQQSLDYLMEAKEIRSKVLDPRHPDVGSTFNNMGVVYSKMGDYKNAIVSYRKALDIWIAAFGTDNPRVAMATNNIGSYYNDRGEYEKALKLFRQSYDIRVRLLGKKHQYTLRVRENMAITKEEMGRVDEACTEFDEILRLNEEVLGKQHPGVAFTSNRVGNCLARKKHYQQAIAAYKRALNIYEKSKGAQNISMAEPLLGLGDVFLHQGKLKKARLSIERALDITEKTFGKRNMDVALVLVKLAGVARRQGKIKEAFDMLQRALPVLEEKFGIENPKVQEANRELTLIREKARKTSKSKA